MKLSFSEQLGAAMIAGLAAATDGHPAQTIERSMQAMRKHLPFDGAWWGLVDDSLDASMPEGFHTAGCIDLSDALRQEYSEISTQDSFAAQLLCHPNQVICWSDTDEIDAPAIQAWVMRHRLAHGAAWSCPKIFSDQFFVVMLYRFEGAPAFNGEEKILIRFLLTQMGFLWGRNIQEMIQTTTSESLTDTLLSKPDGSLIYCGAKMAVRLATLGWDKQGRQTPQALMDFATSGGRMRIGEDWIMISVDEEGLRAQLASHEQTPPLPSRLLRVAALSCEGLSAKEIARELDLSPATVRTYLRDTYQHLGVRNKLQLNSAMSMSSPRRAPPRA